MNTEPGSWGLTIHESRASTRVSAMATGFDWRNWADYLELGAGAELARFVECGCLVMQTEANDHLARHIAICDELGIARETVAAAAKVGQTVNRGAAGATREFAADLLKEDAPSAAASGAGCCG